MRIFSTAAITAFVIASTFLLACGSEPSYPGEGSRDGGNPAEARDGYSAGAGRNLSEESPRAASAGSHEAPSKEEAAFVWDNLTPAAPSTTVDLKNEKDPVTLKPAGEVTLTYKGFIVHFEGEQTRARFEKKPLKYLNMLSLEPLADGGVLRVDAAAYQDAVTEKCPIMTESDVDPHGTVYLLHRGWKVYFCCWSGCGDAFLKEPARYYGHYGLVERDGKLVRK